MNRLRLSSHSWNLRVVYKRTTLVTRRKLLHLLTQTASSYDEESSELMKKTTTEPTYPIDNLNFFSIHTALSYRAHSQEYI